MRTKHRRDRRDRLGSDDILGIALLTIATLCALAFSSVCGWALITTGQYMDPDQWFRAWAMVGVVALAPVGFWIAAFAR